MEKETRKRASDEYGIFEVGDRIPLPDYAMFNEACKEAALELGMKPKDVIRIYKNFIACSLNMLFPEDNPRSLSDEELLHPRRILHVPKVASLEVTEKSLWHWRKVQEAINNSNKK